MRTRHSEKTLHVIRTIPKCTYIHTYMQSIYETSSFIILFFKLVHNKPEKQVTHNWTVTVLSHGVNKLHQISLALQPAPQSCCQLS